MDVSCLAYWLDGRLVVGWLDGWSDPSSAQTVGLWLRDSWVPFSFFSHYSSMSEITGGIDHRPIEEPNCVDVVDVDAETRIFHIF